MGPYGFLCVLGFLWVLIGPSASSCVLMDSDGSLWVLEGPYATLCVLIGLY